MYLMDPKVWSEDAVFLEIIDLNWTNYKGNYWFQCGA